MCWLPYSEFGFISVQSEIMSVQDLYYRSHCGFSKLCLPMTRMFTLFHTCKKNLLYQFNFQFSFKSPVISRDGVDRTQYYQQFFQTFEGEGVFCSEMRFRSFREVKHSTCSLNLLAGNGASKEQTSGSPPCIS